MAAVHFPDAGTLGAGLSLSPAVDLIAEFSQVTLLFHQRASASLLSR